MALTVRPTVFLRSAFAAAIVAGTVALAPVLAQESPVTTTSSTTSSTSTTLEPAAVGAPVPVAGGPVNTVGAVGDLPPESGSTVPVTAPQPVSVAAGPTATVAPPQISLDRTRENSGLDDTGQVAGAVITLPPGSDVAIGDVGDDDGSPEAPPSNVVVPPAPPYQAPASSITLKQALGKLTAEQRKVVEEARVKADEATARLQAAQTSLVALTNQGAAGRRDLQRLQGLRDSTAGDMRDRALRQYTGESVGYLNLLLSSQDVATLSRRADFVSQAQRRDAELVLTYRDTAKALEAKQAELDLIVAQRQREVDGLAAEQKTLSEEFAKVDAQLQSITKGIPIALNGFVFPVQLPASFVDTYGADRMKGTKYYHLHQGVDIFAPQGTPLRAVKRGVINSLGVAVLGGNKLWLTDSDGTAYYYAHLSQFAVGIDNGSVVEAGQIIGFVGTTGNAAGTPAHLHFEIHPGGGDPVNPTPILKAVKDSDINDLVKALNPTLPNLGSTTIAGEPSSTGTSAPKK